MGEQEFERLANAAGWLLQDDGAWARLADTSEADTQPFGNDRRVLILGSAREACQRDGLCPTMPANPPPAQIADPPHVEGMTPIAYRWRYLHIPKWTLRSTPVQGKNLACEPLYGTADHARLRDQLERMTRENVSKDAEFTRERRLWRDRETLLERDREAAIDRSRAAHERVASAEARLAAVQEGWRLVPVEADDAMLEAGHDAVVEGREWGRMVSPSEVWSAMLAAAPTPPAAKEG